MTTSRRAALAALGAASTIFATLFTPTAALADYPDRPVKVVVPYAPGGATDVVARIFADQLDKQLNQRFLVENKPGANAVIGADFVAKSPMVTRCCSPADRASRRCSPRPCPSS